MKHAGIGIHLTPSSNLWKLALVVEDNSTRDHPTRQERYCPVTLDTDVHQWGNITRNCHWKLYKPHNVSQKHSLASKVVDRFTNAMINEWKKQSYAHFRQIPRWRTTSLNQRQLGLLLDLLWEVWVGKRSYWSFALSVGELGCPTGRHATWYGSSISNTDFCLFWDDTAVSRWDTDFRQLTGKSVKAMPHVTISSTISSTFHRRQWLLTLQT